MIELTQELSLAIRTGGGEPIRLTDPATKETFVLVREDEYRRLTSDADTGPWTDEEMDLLAQEDADRLGWEGMEVYQDEQP